MIPADQKPAGATLWSGSESWQPDAVGWLSVDDQWRIVGASGLLDVDWYRGRSGMAADGDVARHFVEEGAAAGVWPNPYFDPHWYLDRNPDVRRAAINPLVHYIVGGEAEGRAPCGHFDLAWYAERHQAEPGETWLGHFLTRRRDGSVSPMADFDVLHYLASYPDVAAAGVDPFDHFWLHGYKEGRNPSAHFDTRFYQRRYLGGSAAENPLHHWRRHRDQFDLATAPSPAEPTAFDEVRRFSRPGPAFEDRQALPAEVRREARVLAYYLPQFHAIAENDSWWGAGFTEWTAVARGMPRFAGHYQPRTPRDLGHYTLAEPGNATMRRQIAMAREAGLFGFVQYFYWFNRRRLLQAPLEAFLTDASLDFPFCLMWARDRLATTAVLVVKIVSYWKPRLRLADAS